MTNPAVILLGLFVGLGANGLPGQNAIDTTFPRRGKTGYVALRQAVLDAQTDRQVLLVASHPDDQYVAAAAYLRFRLGYRVSAALFTRGKGGQNSAGPETGGDLGRLRTLESEACASHLGIKIYYLNRRDGGYCRTAKEALAEWEVDSTTVDLARLIRLIKPDLVMTTHHGDEKHGHDLALLQILPEAVAKAGDETLSIAGTSAHKVDALLRGAVQDESAHLSLDLDSMEPVRGRTYRELAYAALKEHHSQEPLQAQNVVFLPSLNLVSLPLPDRPLLTALQGGQQRLFTLLEPLLAAEDLQHLRNLTIPKLRTWEPQAEDLASVLTARKICRSVIAAEGTELASRLGCLLAAYDRLITLAAGIRVTAKVVDDQDAVPGDALPLEIDIRNDGPLAIEVQGVRGLAGGKMQGDPLQGDSRARKLAPGAKMALQAVFLPAVLTQEELRRLFTQDSFEPPLQLSVTIGLSGEELPINLVLQTEVRPASAVQIIPRSLMLPAGASLAKFVVSVRRYTAKGLDLLLRVNPPAGTTLADGVLQLKSDLVRSRQETFNLRASPNLSPSVSNMFVHLGEDSIKVKVHKVDVHVSKGLRVGLVPGVDPTAEEVLLSLLGEDPQLLNSAERLLLRDLSKYDTIVVDIRSLRNSYARDAFPRLLNFAQKGGRLVVFYHKDSEFNLATAGFRGAPYPLVIGKGRVTQRDAPVTTLLPDHVLLNYPNKILNQDWDGWQQERGLYFPAKYSDDYEEVLEMSDSDLPKQRGSLLYARYGKGEYIYCALSLYRQLKNRHPGACRLFANMISPVKPD